MDPVSVYMSIKNIFSFFGKDPSKEAYDNGTASAYAELQKLYDEVIRRERLPLDDPQRITRSFLRASIDAMRGSLSDFEKFTDSYRSRIDASWIEPRFANLYDFWSGIIDEFSNKMNLIPVDYTNPTEVVQTSLATMAGGGMGTFLMVGLLIGGVYMFTRRR